MLTVIHVCALKRGELLELNGHVGGRVRVEAEVVSKAVAWVDSRGFYGVNASDGGTDLVVSTADREPLKERFEEEGDKEGREGFPLHRYVKPCTHDQYGR
jgi:hypothetical protein